MRLTWTPLNANGQPKIKPAFQRQLEQLNPEIAAGLHLPKLARVENYTEPAKLGDIADPFRPKYAVGVQLLDENGQDSKGTTAYPAVQLPVTIGGDESGFMQYPPPGTLVALAFQDGSGITKKPSVHSKSYFDDCSTNFLHGYAASGIYLSKRHCPSLAAHSFTSAVFSGCVFLSSSPP